MRISDVLDIIEGILEIFKPLSFSVYFVPSVIVISRNGSYIEFGIVEERFEDVFSFFVLFFLAIVYKVTGEQNR